MTISRLVNAFFRWEFNSCENLVAGTEVHPIDYANACPDVALTSLHYYFPWAMAALCAGRCSRWSPAAQPRLDLDMAQYFAIADRDDLSYGEKLAAYRRLADELLRDRPLPRLLREPAGPPRRGRAGVGGRARTSTRCWSRRCAPPTRPPSTTGSSPTSAAWSGCGCATRRRPPSRPERRPAHKLGRSRTGSNLCADPSGCARAVRMAGGRGVSRRRGAGRRRSARSSRSPAAARGGARPPSRRRRPSPASRAAARRSGAGRPATTSSPYAARSASSPSTPVIRPAPWARLKMLPAL